jgi:predicted dehydrogenase
LVGRNPDKLAALAAAHGGLQWSTDVGKTLTDTSIEIYFDSAATGGRLDRIMRAIAAGKHVYTEKPVANSSAEAMQMVRAAKAAGLKAAAVQDKVYLPGFNKLRQVRDSGFLGRILSARLEGGWWVFDGEVYPSQRSSWNYRKELPQSRWRRTRARYVSALALSHREPDGADQGRVVPQDDAAEEAPGRERQAIRCGRRGRSVRDVRV